MLQDFENRIAHWSVSPKIADVIVKKGPFLKLYTTYIREFSAVNYHFDDCCQKFPKFAKLVKDFEKKELCRHLKLKHFMLKPVQRLPQYKLLLEDYLRHLSHESSDFDDTTAALKIVSDAAEHANNTIRQGVSHLFFYLISFVYTFASFNNNNVLHYQANAHHFIYQMENPIYIGFHHKWCNLQ